jgi:SAM-dependent methyltransferase
MFRCPDCGYLSSNLEPDIKLLRGEKPIDEASRSVALEELRKANFDRMLDALGKIHDPAGKRLLDVGCAHGWFLDAAAKRGYQVFGLEPDVEMAALASARHRVITGFFPQDIPPGEIIDVITFNDVLEHLPDVSEAASACGRLLAPGGLVGLTLPISTGIFYRTAQLLDSFGISGPFERLWQKEFPSPHMSYFTADQLGQLMEKYGLKTIHRSTLPSIQIQGLWERLRYDRTAPVAQSVLIWLGVALASPLLKALPPDIVFLVFQKQ